MSAPVRPLALAAGPVMVIGGAEDKLRHKAILTRFAKFAGLAEGHVVVISTASSLGDEATHGATDADFQCAFFDVYAARLRRTPVWPLLGNLDSDFHEGVPYYRIFRLPSAAESGGVASGSEQYYSFNHGPIHFICLDSVDSVRTAGSPMLQWLTNELAHATQRWTIVCFHDAPYTHHGPRDPRQPRVQRPLPAP